VSIGHEPGSGPTFVEGAPLLDPLVLPELLPPLPLELLLLLDPDPLPLELLLPELLLEPPLPLPLELPPELPLPPLELPLDPLLQSAEPNWHWDVGDWPLHAEARRATNRDPAEERLAAR
jgi:hypothetical protein